MNLWNDRFQIGDQPRLLVIGDLILDRYTWGRASRVSPEAPVLVLDAEQSEVRAGGAASVAVLLRGLDVHVSLAGVAGDDHDGRTLRSVLCEAGVDQTLICADAERITTAKERFLGRAEGRSPHQILRVDHEVRTPLSDRLEAEMLDSLLVHLTAFEAVLIADYAKGCCTGKLLTGVIAAARQLQLPVLIDPGRGRDLGLYRGSTLIKPNRREAEALTGLSIVTPDDGLQAARILCETGDLDAAVVTLDQLGMVYATADGSSGRVPTRTRAVCDITGAGDMALAALGLALASRRSIPEAVDLANLAAGLEVERLGIEPISRQELETAWNQATPQHSGKILSLDELVPVTDRCRREEKRIVFTNGCFDLLHAGHLKCLEEARRLGDVLIVAINSDSSVRRLKGPERPVIAESDRAALLAGLACVDFVTIFDDPTPHNLLSRLRPDILTKGGTTTDVVGREVVDQYGGQVVTTGQFPERSTTELVHRIRQAVSHKH